jgi:hypothetical protein
VAGVTRIAAREFVSGESVCYLGRQHRVRVLERTEPAPVLLDHGKFIVTVARGLAPATRAASGSRRCEGS